MNERDQARHPGRGCCWSTQLLPHLASRIMTKTAPPQEGTDERACVDCYGL